MASTEGTYDQLNYLLRPSKQIERRLIIESLTQISRAGYSMRDYSYLGMGSPFYADFIMFHKHLYIERMICMEQDDIPKRMQFNLPFSSVKLYMKAASEIGGYLDREQRHLVWLDYDYALSKSVLQDVGVLLNILPAGSIFIVTVAAQPTFARDEESEDERNRERTRLLIELDTFFSSVHPVPPTIKDTTRRGLPRYYANVLHSHFLNELGRRQDGVNAFFQLFSMRYADGMQMLTFGGMIEKQSEFQKLQSSGVYNLDFIRSLPDAEPLEISVPPLTPRERHWLDQRQPEGIAESELEFELQPGRLENYQRYYRYYPAFNESVF